MRKLIDSAVFLAIFTAVLYCVSTAHYQGYLVTLELDSELMDRNFHQVLYQGLLVSLLPIFYSLLLVTVVSFFVAHALVPTWVSFLRKSIGNKRCAIKVKRIFLGRYKDSDFEVKIKRYSSSVAFVFAIYAVSVVYLSYIERLGKNSAEELKRNILAGKVEATKSVEVNNMHSRPLLLLACGARNCAGFDLKTSKIHYFESKNLTFKSTKYNKAL